MQHERKSTDSGSDRLADTLIPINGPIPAKNDKRKYGGVIPQIYSVRRLAFRSMIEPPFLHCRSSRRPIKAKLIHPATRSIHEQTLLLHQIPAVLLNRHNPYKIKRKKHKYFKMSISLEGWIRRVRGLLYFLARYVLFIATYD